MPRRSTLLLALTIIAALVLAACSGPNDGDDPTSASQASTATSPAASTPATSATSTPATQPPAVTATPTTAPQPTETPQATSTSEPTVTPTNTPEPTVTPTPVLPTPTSTQSAGQDVITIRTADTDEPIVALTFDAGADRGYAEEILDTLHTEGVVATFGMTGDWAEANPDLVLRMVDEGHMLMNHTETHRSWTGFSTSAAPLTSAERAAELRATEAVIQAIAGYDMRPYFRPPYGDYDDSLIADLQANGYTVNVMWTVDSLGWKGLTAAEITARTLDGTIPGAIHLFHVGAASLDAAALPDIIRGLRDLGYRFVTVDEMVGR